MTNPGTLRKKYLKNILGPLYCFYSVYNQKLSDKIGHFTHRFVTTVYSAILLYVTTGSNAQFNHSSCQAFAQLMEVCLKTPSI